MLDLLNRNEHGQNNNIRNLLFFFILRNNNADNGTDHPILLG